MIRALGELAGTPAEVLGNREMLELYLPALRADLRFSEGYCHEAGPALRCPIFAFGGVEDLEVSESELAAWNYLQLVTSEHPPDAVEEAALWEMLGADKRDESQTASSTPHRSPPRYPRPCAAKAPSAH